VNILSPTTYASAQELASSYGARAQFVAGATLFSVEDIAQRSSRANPPAIALIDISHLPDTKGIRLTPDSLRIGAATSLEVVRTDSMVALHAPLLQQACKTIGSMALRYQATLGGNLGWRRGDGIAPLMIYGAWMELSNGETRLVDTLCERTHVPLIVAIHLPLQSNQVPSANLEDITFFEKVSERQAFSITRVALALKAKIATTPNRQRYISSMRAAAGGASFDTVVLKELTSALSKVTLRSSGLPDLVFQACRHDLPDDLNVVRLIANLVTGHLQS
jgi:CO/xanthine dehydrogenase FAD-binding subunit